MGEKREHRGFVAELSRSKQFHKLELETVTHPLITRAKVLLLAGGGRNWHRPSENGFQSDAQTQQSARDVDHRDGFLGAELSHYEIPRSDSTKAGAGVR